jgi:GWxTD domain-containing protein
MSWGIRRFASVSSAILLILTLQPGYEGQAQRSDQRKREEAVDHYKRWLDEDVVFIITDEERVVFKSLATEDEKEAFIEQFWRRRDPDPDTTINEFREEHYRRIAYANDHFSIGVPGWKSDRGRIYIIHGPPDSREYHDQGQQYYRPARDGGGVTNTYSFEVWYYRNIPGVGDGIEIEFVDKTMTGHFTLARDEMDKEASLWVPGIGLTEAERLGGAYRSERLGTRSMASMASRRIGSPLNMFSQKDDLFARLFRYARLQAPPTIKFKDLESIVDIRLYYNQLPFSVRHDLIKIAPGSYLVPVTFYFQTDEFLFKTSGTLGHASLNLYGRVETLGRQRVYAFDDTVHLNLTSDRKGEMTTSVFQRNIPLEPGRYKLVAIVKDVHGGKIGTLERGIHIPAENEDLELEMSSLILADQVQPAKSGEFITDPFILSGVKVYPSADNRFKRGSPLGFYFEVYNVMADQQTLEPSLSLDLALSREGQPIPLPFSDLHRLLHRYADRFFAGSMLSTEPLQPGRYNLSVTVTDKIAGSTTSQNAAFEVF